LKGFFDFLKGILVSRSVIFTLAKSKFREQYLGSYLGAGWVFIRPVSFVCAIWAVFAYGFKVSEVSEHPFLVYLLAGYIPWIFFSEAISEGVNSIVSNKYLVKTVALNVAALPFSVILKMLFLHIVFFSVLLVVLFIFGYNPNVYWLQIPVYMFFLVLLIVGVTFFVASIRVFAKDIAYGVGLVMQVGIWISPVFWSIAKIPLEYHYILQFNPLVFIVDGYRNALLNEVWFWNDLEFFLGYSFWTVLSLACGFWIFMKTKPHFTEVL
jgi:ABC-type polysaccharide/polyol phosphate export permease